jgi:archaemetzincin
MRIAILRVGPVDMEVVASIQRGLCDKFPGATCEILENTMPIPQDAYNASRHQYHSTKVLARIQDYAEKSIADKALGVTEVDLYMLRLNFVFGEAQCPGRSAVISLFRLKPEFYGQQPNKNLFLERSTKEAVHEVGHTLGLGHCHNQTCIMFFSNSILDTDRKKLSFCERCYPLVLKRLEGLPRS